MGCDGGTSRATRAREQHSKIAVGGVRRVVFVELGERECFDDGASRTSLYDGTPDAA